MGKLRNHKHVYLFIAYLFHLLLTSAATFSTWLNHGGDLFNRRYARTEIIISRRTAPKLHPRWRFFTGTDVSATPAFYENTLYFPSWDGNLYAVRGSDGSLVWKQNLETLTGLRNVGYIENVNSTVSRSTPTVAGNLLVVGIYGPAVVIAVRRRDGNLVWMTELDDQPRSVITMSGTYYQGAVYIGTSSIQEALSVEECCTFRGSMAKLDILTGKIVWQTYMLPDNLGQLGDYAGASLWGSSPSIDPLRKHVYIATGNLYSAPLRIRECQERLNNQTTPVTDPDQCIEPENHSNSILALHLSSGQIIWFKQLGGYDVFILACYLNPNLNCPPGPSPDADFGEAPMILSARVNGSRRDVVVAVQKSGFAWCLDRDDGSLVWFTEAGPGGLGGGGIWGAATDGLRIFTNIANTERKNFTLKPNTAANTTSGGWVAMDAHDGGILWTTADPSGGTATGPVTVANGVVFTGSTYRDGPVYAMSALTGEILWTGITGATVYGGASVANGCAYVGSGYKVGIGFTNANYTSGSYVYAFCVF